MALKKILIDFFVGLHIPPVASEYLSILILIGAILLVSWLVKKLIEHYLLSFCKKIAQRTSTKWDDIVFQEKLPDRLALLIPGIIVYFISDMIFVNGAGGLLKYINLACALYMTFAGILIVGAALNTIEKIYNTYESSSEVPIKSFLQVIKIFFYFAAAIIIISLLLQQSPWALLKALGVIAGVAMLVFKDSILGLVASIQLSGQKMVRKGDWIEMPKFGANGDVVDISLTTVKVQNFDKTIINIPTYALVSNSFQNWRGMVNSGGRRIKRSVILDMHSFKFLDEKDLNKLKKNKLISEYICRKEQELKEENQKWDISSSSKVNARRLTNVGTFRYYIKEYLANNANIHNSMTFIVRQLQPTAKGLPIEIYVFTNDTDWVRYEEIQADVFDHILTIVPEFGLSTYQDPSGRDIKESLSQFKLSQS
ncbi:MAG: mechanosensitive ion channel [Lentisphaerae bacterium]|nr:mechanosensitive ion channel [Lentisphaerota bacterium]MCP4101379.1 mechanosensitive ion channel [Lentisphaerota bacterium]